MTRRKLNTLERRAVMAAAMEHVENHIMDTLRKQQFDIKNGSPQDLDFDVHIKVNISSEGTVRCW